MTRSSISLSATWIARRESTISCWRATSRIKWHFNPKPSGWEISRIQETIHVSANILPQLRTYFYRRQPWKIISWEGKYIPECKILCLVIWMRRSPKVNTLNLSALFKVKIWKQLVHYTVLYTMRPWYWNPSSTNTRIKTNSSRVIKLDEFLLTETCSQWRVGISNCFISSIIMCIFYDDPIIIWFRSLAVVFGAADVMWWSIYDAGWASHCFVCLYNLHCDMSLHCEVRLCNEFQVESRLQRGTFTTLSNTHTKHWQQKKNREI